MPGVSLPAAQGYDQPTFNHPLMVITGAGMTQRRTATIGGAVTFIMAGAAGAAGGQLAESTLWAWICLVATLLIGGVVTGWTTWRTTPDDTPPGSEDPPPGGPNLTGRLPASVHIGDVSAPDGQAAGIVHGNMIRTSSGSAPGNPPPPPDSASPATHPPAPGGVQIGNVSAPGGQAAGIVHGNMIENRGGSGA